MTEKPRPLTWKQKLELKLNHPHTLKAAEMIGKVGGLAVHLTKDTTLLGKMSVVGAGAAAMLLSKPPLSMFYSDFGRIDLGGPVEVFLWSRLSRTGHFQPHLETPGSHSWRMTLEDGTEIAVLLDHGKDQHEDRARALPKLRYRGSKEAATKALGRLLWETFPSTNLVLKKNADAALIEEGKLDETAPSKLARDIYEDVKAFNLAGHNRSYMIEGPPGSGKSVAARQTAELRGGFSLYVPAPLIDSDEVESFINLLQPKTIICDDLCRHTGYALLTALEKMKKACPLFIATANYPEKLDPAVRRPGRFDKIFHLAKLDDDAVALMLPGVPLGIAKQLAQLPAAYINEFKIVREVHGMEAALQRVKELEARAEKLDAQGQTLNQPTTLSAGV